MQRNSNSPISIRTASTVIFLIAVLIGQVAQTFDYRESLEGHPVRWRAQRIHVVLDESLATLGDMDVVEYLVVDAFDEWVEAGSLPIEFSFTRGSCWANYEHNGQNENCIFTQAGPNHSKEDSGATTFVTYGDNTGAIRDSDIVIYSEAADWSLEKGDGGDFALKEALIHEIGHFLGLTHTPIAEARMFPYMNTVEPNELITLHEDDRLGVAALYTDLEPGDDATSCSVTAPGGTKTNWTILVLCLGLMAIVLRRRPAIQ